MYRHKVNLEKDALSKLARHNRECVVQAPPIPERTFSLSDGQELYLWGERNDLATTGKRAVGLGVRPQGKNLTDEEIAQAKKARIDFSEGVFFFLFNGENGQIEVELLKLESSFATEGMIFRRTGHVATL